MSKKRIAIFASGTGSNAQKIMEYFQDHESIQIELVVSNKENAPVLDKAQVFGVDSLILDKINFYDSNELLDFLETKGIDFIVLAGFLWLVPDYLTQAFFTKIINIHPALLPDFGGKGMYGMHVHEAVKTAGVEITGITIHYVNERYDEGDIIFQAQCEINAEDTPKTIAEKVRTLEHQYYAPIIEQLLMEY